MRHLDGLLSPSPLSLVSITFGDFKAIIPQNIWLLVHLIKIGVMEGGNVNGKMWGSYEVFSLSKMQ